MHFKKLHEANPTELMGEMDKAKMIVEDFRTLSSNEQENKKVNTVVEELNTINQLHLLDSYNTLYLNNSIGQYFQMHKKHSLK